MTIIISSINIYQYNFVNFSQASTAIYSSILKTTWWWRQKPASKSANGS